MNPARRKPDIIPLQDVLIEFRRKYGWTQQEVGEALGKGQSWVSRLEKHKPDDNRYRAISLDEIIKVEDHFDLPRGTMLRMAGMVEDSTSVADAIRHDPKLKTEDSEMLLELYERMTRRGPKALAAERAPAVTRHRTA